MAVRQRRRAASARRSAPGKARSGCLIWLIPVALGTILLLANSDARRHIEMFLDSLTGNQSPQTNTVRHQPAAPANNAARPATPPGKQNGTARQPAADKLPEPGNPALIHELIRQDQARLAEQPGRGETPASPAPTGPGGKAVRVFFIAYDRANDRFHPTPVTRHLPGNDNPARDTLQLLIAGPDAAEKRRGLNTLIPPGTRIRSLRIDGGIAYTDLSREFTGDLRYGREGLLLQIRQIVDTLCQFPAIKGVRFLIENRPAGVIGGDGVTLDRVFHPES